MRRLICIAEKNRRDIHDANWAQVRTCYTADFIVV